MMNEEKDYYRPLPFFKQVWVNIVEKIKEKKRNYRFKWWRLAIFLLIVAIVATIYFVVVKNQVVVPVRDPYDKTGFVYADQDNEGENYFSENETTTILENNNYKLTFDNVKTSFVLLDKTTTIEWASNPDENAARFLDQMVIYYAGALGAAVSMTTYTNAVNRYFDYAIRKTENSLEVLYMIGGKKEHDSSDFPQVMTAERMQTMILDKIESHPTLTDSQKNNYSNRITRTFYQTNSLSGNEVWTLKDIAQQSMINLLYEIFYEVCGYTREDLIYDIQLSGIEYEETTYPYFEIAIKYTLTTNGMDVDVINSSIVESEDYPLLYIDVLPYFGCATSTDTGFALVPDGSGIVIDYNNSRSFALPYNQRIYGKDLAVQNNYTTSSSETIIFPMFGVNRNNSGFIAAINQGAAQATILVNTFSTAYKYNQAYYRFNYRESEVYKFTTISSNTVVTEWTDHYSTSDFSISLVFVHEDNASYSAMAKTYQAYLVAKDYLTDNDITSSVMLDLTLLGGYIVQENFIGFNYKTVRSLTNANNAKTIVDKLLNDKVSNINLIYQGWTNDGIKSTYNGKLGLDKVTATKKQLIALQEYLQSVDVNFYPEVNVFTSYGGKNIDENEIAVRDVFGNVVKNSGFYQSVYASSEDTASYYILKPTTYETTINKISNYFTKLTLKNIAISDLGNASYGSYHHKDAIFRDETETLTIQALNNCTNRFEKVLLHRSNVYALKYANNIVDAPSTGTNYQIVSYSIPFYQLVLNGYVDYSSASFNLNDQKDYNWHMMKAIETLSNLNFTWSYSETVDLLDTEYDKYYATYYLNKYDDVVAMYNEVNSLNIYGLTIAKHEVLSSDGLLTKTTYSNGLEIVFNYTNTSRVINNINIAPNTYTIVKEAN